MTTKRKTTCRPTSIPSRKGNKAGPQLPMPRCVGRPTKYDPAYCDLVIEHAAKTGRSLTAFAGELRISRQTLNVWAAEHPEFFEAMGAAKAGRAAVLEKRADKVTNGPQMNYLLLGLRNCAPEDWRDAKDLNVAGKVGAQPQSLNIAPDDKRSITEIAALFIQADASADEIMRWQKERHGRQ